MQASSALDRHRLGMELRQLRTARSLRLEDAAMKLGVAPSTLCRIETGIAAMKLGYLSTLLDLYGVTDPEQREQLRETALAGQRKDRGAEYASLLPAKTGAYLGLEAEAEQVRGFAAHSMPPLVQAPGYAEAFFRATRTDLCTADIDGLVMLQLRHQRLVHQEGRMLELVLDESVLIRSIGSTQVMADQLRHLLTFADDPSLTVRVIRLATAHPVLCPSFTLLRLPGATDPGIACLESIGGHVDVKRRTADVQALRTMFEALARSALSPASSAKLIGKYADNCLPSR